MPTGYTADFENKDVTFSEFVWKCARGMGALYHMRDDNFNAEIRMPDISDYYEQSFASAVARLEELKSMSLVEANQLKNAEREEKIKWAKERIEKIRILKDRYYRMLAQVEVWVPPTPDHESLKKFMLDQLKQSLDFDCEDKYYYEKLNPPEQSAAAWLQTEIEGAESRVKYAHEHWLREQESNKEIINWIKELQQSVPLSK